MPRRWVLAIYFASLLLPAYSLQQASLDALEAREPAKKGRAKAKHPLSPSKNPGPQCHSSPKPAAPQQNPAKTPTSAGAQRKAPVEKNQKKNQARGPSGQASPRVGNSKGKNPNRGQSHNGQRTQASKGKQKQKKQKQKKQKQKKQKQKNRASSGSVAGGGKQRGHQSGPRDKSGKSSSVGAKPTTQGSHHVSAPSIGTDAGGKSRALAKNNGKRPSGLPNTHSKSPGLGKPPSILCRRSDGDCPTTADGWMEYMNDPNWAARLAASLPSLPQTVNTPNQATGQQQNIPPQIAARPIRLLPQRGRYSSSAGTFVSSSQSPPPQTAPSINQNVAPASINPSTGQRLQQQGPANVPQQAVHNPSNAVGGSSSLFGAMGGYTYGAPPQLPPHTDSQNTNTNTPAFVQGSSSGVKEGGVVTQWLRKKRVDDPEHYQKYMERAKISNAKWRKKKSQAKAAAKRAGAPPVKDKTGSQRSRKNREKLRMDVISGDPAAIARYEEIKRQGRERSKRYSEKKERKRKQRSEGDGGSDGLQVLGKVALEGRLQQEIYWWMKMIIGGNKWVTPSSDI
ncbi:hypothetical protein FA15DRAFT_655897 [Coprinopsis marcescibilis]|uniref:FMR1-interacting protein 1 conserved domain-containing protein n=1 Tax=Coprinopsis marcescibilis TaxID=230819 RepID=A0A5C3KVM2_COPMA|nr:hypothetical protein FA15DRAFT_655897 [Coprinopsis marcescibilis]